MLIAGSIPGVAQGVEVESSPMLSSISFSGEACGSRDGSGKEEREQEGHQPKQSAYANTIGQLVPL